MLLFELLGPYQKVCQGRCARLTISVDCLCRNELRSIAGNPLSVRIRYVSRAYADCFKQAFDTTPLIEVREEQPAILK